MVDLDPGFFFLFHSGVGAVKHAARWAGSVRLVVWWCLPPLQHRCVVVQLRPKLTTTTG